MEQLILTTVLLWTHALLEILFDIDFLMTSGASSNPQKKGQDNIRRIRKVTSNLPTSSDFNTHVSLKIAERSGASKDGGDCCKVRHFFDNGSQLDSSPALQV